jgi:hypothetical protein
MKNRPTLREPIDIAKFWKNRKGEAVLVQLSTFENHNLISVRTWFQAEDGKMRPSKGFTANVRHLPKLAKALAAAVEKARKLHLIDGDEGGDQ